jgi:CRISPR-associated protein Cas2
MTVIVLIGATPGLRGHLTRWMAEIAPGVFVGGVNPRIRGKLWELVCERIGTGQAILIQTQRTEQGWTAATAGRDRWIPTSVDGITLIRRP